MKFIKCTNFDHFFVCYCFNISSWAVQIHNLWTSHCECHIVNVTAKCVRKRYPPLRTSTLISMDEVLFIVWRFATVSHFSSSSVSRVIPHTNIFYTDSGAVVHNHRNRYCWNPRFGTFLFFKLFEYEKF